jgi:hypothetical protein
MQPATDQHSGLRIRGLNDEQLTAVPLPLSECTGVAPAILLSHFIGIKKNNHQKKQFNSQFKSRAIRISRTT